MDGLQITRRILWYGLGGLWLLDGALQLQPHMFSADLVTAVMQPNAWHQPSWMTQSIDWILNLLLTHQLSLFNGFVALLQIGIGALVLSGFDKKSGRIALWTSLVWGSLVWYFGEGLGTVFTGQATYLTGAPGSVLLYMIIAVFLLATGRLRKTDERILDLNSWRRSVGALWILGALLQCFPVFWTPDALSTQFYGAAVMTSRSFLTRPIYAMAHLSLHHTLWWNLAFVLAMFSLALGLFRRWGAWFYALVTMWLLFMFWIGENGGMLLSGVATDLNTAPVWALMMFPLYLEARRSEDRNPT